MLTGWMSFVAGFRARPRLPAPRAIAAARRQRNHSDLFFGCQRAGPGSADDRERRYRIVKGTIMTPATPAALAAPLHPGDVRRRLDGRARRLRSARSQGGAGDPGPRDLLGDRLARRGTSSWRPSCASPCGTRARRRDGRSWRRPPTAGRRDRGLELGLLEGVARQGRVAGPGRQRSGHAEAGRRGTLHLDRRSGRDVRAPCVEGRLGRGLHTGGQLQRGELRHLPHRAPIGSKGLAP
jgi:hypothetical protein